MLQNEFETEKNSTVKLHQTEVILLSTKGTVLKCLKIVTQNQYV